MPTHLTSPTIVCRAKQSLYEDIPSQLYTLVWLLAQHLEASVQLPPQTQQIEQQGRPSERTGAFVAMAHCLYML